MQPGQSATYLKTTAARKISTNQFRSAHTEFSLMLLAVYQLDAISQGPKNSPFPGPNPLPLAHIMYLPASKTLRRGPYRGEE
jgi:hypothetical protein